MERLVGLASLHAVFRRALVPLVLTALSACGGGSGGGGGSSPPPPVQSPTLDIEDARSLEGGPGERNILRFRVSLQPTAGGRVNVDYATEDDTARAGDDYLATSGTLEFGAGETERFIEVVLLGDDSLEPNETLAIVLDNPSANASLNRARGLGMIENDEYRPLNDTGVTACANNLSTGLACPLPDFPGQDADYGRDADGPGFELVAVAGGACVEDLATGLVWELKTDDGGYRDKDWSYTWFQPDTTLNGGDAGVRGDAFSAAQCDTSSLDGIASCDTAAYVAAANERALCGFTDWRVPAREELRSIVDYSRYDPAVVAVFANTLPDDRTGDFAGAPYWARESKASNTANAHRIYFRSGRDQDMPKGEPALLRLVRGPR